jgi:beta-lactamase regulating signal transducer with metallopeptidase domain
MIETTLLLALLLKVTTSLAIGLLVVRLLRRARAATRHLVLATTFVALLLVPLAHLAGPRIDVEVGMLAPAEDVRGRAKPGGDTLAPTTAVPPDAAAATGRIERTPTNPLLPWTPGTIAIGLWVGGAACLLLTLAFDLARARRLRRNGLPAPEWIVRASHIVGVGRGASSRDIEILLSDEVAGPLVIGCRPAAIVLPVDAESWHTDALQRVLAHELSHVRRADWIVQIVARAICAIHWFHPLVWMAWRQLHLEAERACDDEVLKQAGAGDYAGQLVSIARSSRAASRSGVVVGMATRSDLATRVRAILDPTVRRGHFDSMTTVATLVAATGAFALIGPLQAVGAPRHQVGHGTVVPADAAAPTGTDRELFDAAARGDVDRMTRLIAGGTNVNAVIRGDGSPLIGAVRNRQVDAARLLLDRGADPNLSVTFDGSPLIAAAAQGHPDLVHLLIARGADPALPVPFDGNPLIAAARNGHLEIVRTLLEFGVPIDDVVPGDETALMSASYAGQLDAVRLLVEHGADVNLRAWAEPGPGRPDGEWRTPLKMAHRAGHTAIVDYLRSVGARE